MTEQAQITAAVRRRARLMANSYLKTLQESNSEVVRDSVVDLLRDTMRNFGLTPEETDDPEMCRWYCR